MVPVSQRRRIRANVPREERRNVRFSRDEMATIQIAAERAHLTDTGFIAESAVQAALGMPTPAALSTTLELATERLAGAVVQLQDTLTEAAPDDIRAQLDWVGAEVMKLRG